MKHLALGLLLLGLARSVEAKEQKKFVIKDPTTPVAFEVGFSTASCTILLLNDSDNAVVVTLKDGLGHVADFTEVEAKGIALSIVEVFALVRGRYQIESNRKGIRIVVACAGDKA